MKKFLLILLFQLSFSALFAEILVFKNCTNKEYSFEKNVYAKKIYFSCTIHVRQCPSNPMGVYIKG